MEIDYKTPKHYPHHNLLTSETLLFIVPPMQLNIAGRCQFHGVCKNFDIQFLAKRPKRSLQLNSFSVAVKYPSPYPTPTSIVLLLLELYLKYSVNNLLIYNTLFDTLEWKILTIRTENWDFLWHSHFNWEFTAKWPARPLLRPWNWQGQTLFHATIFSLFGGVYCQLATV